MSLTPNYSIILRFFVGLGTTGPGQIRFGGDEDDIDGVDVDTVGVVDCNPRNEFNVDIAWLIPSSLLLTKSLNALYSV